MTHFKVHIEEDTKEKFEILCQFNKTTPEEVVLMFIDDYFKENGDKLKWLGYDI